MDNESESQRPEKRQRTVKIEDAAEALFVNQNGERQEKTPEPLEPASAATASTIQLNPEQQHVHDLILSRRNVFYTGPAGSGKSTLLKISLPELVNKGLRVRKVAPTGTAAYNIRGSTIHSFFGLKPRDLGKPIRELCNKARFAPYLEDRIKNTDVLFIDEISMVSNEFLDRMDQMMRAGKCIDRSFGGVQVIATGDFCQLGPINPFQYCIECGKERIAFDYASKFRCPTHLHGVKHLEDRWAFQSSAWESAKFQHVLLSEVHRQTDDEFKRILFKLWLGKQLHTAEQRLLTNHNFTGINPIRIFATKDEVFEINSREFAKLPGLTMRCSALDDFKWHAEHRWLQYKGDRCQSDTEHLQAQQDHRYDTYLQLKVGMPVVLLINLDVGQGLVNGSRGLIVGFQAHKEAEMPKPRHRLDQQPTQYFRGNDPNMVSDFVPALGGTYTNYRFEKVKEFIRNCEKKAWPIVRFENGRKVTVYAACDIQELGDDEPYSLLTRTQIPLQAGWAITIHKAQGMTLTSVEVNVSKTFEQGQVYVAISRATTLSGIRVLGMQRGFVCGSGHPEVHDWLRDKFPRLRDSLDE